MAAAVVAVSAAVSLTQVPLGPQVGTVRQAPLDSGTGTPGFDDDDIGGLPAEVSDLAARQAAIERLLLDRGEAVRRDDEGTWRRLQVAAASTPDFARLAALPIVRWTYTVEATTSAADPTQVSLVATVSYRLDVDAEDALVREELDLQHTDTGWRVASERTEGPRAQPWDLGEIAVERGTRSVVIGIDTPAATLREYARLADTVGSDVSALWGRDWTRSPVLVVARSTDQLARALSRSTTSLRRIAAVTTAEDGTGSAEERRGADRVWTNTPVMATLSALGREIVLRHEVLHVAVGAAATNATPLWLEEGLAEYVGYRGSGVALRIAVGDVLREVRAGRAPRSLPSPAEFAGSDIAEAYESAHVACDLVVDRYGEKGLVRLYRLTADGTGSPQANVDAALRSVTGTGFAAFEQAWRTRLRTLAG